MRKYRIILLSIFLFLSYSSSSQDDSSLVVLDNIFFVEGFGSGGYGSVNYERMIFRKNNFTIATRIGIGGYHFFDYTNQFNPDLIIPIAVNAFYGIKHHVEFGIGQTVSSFVQPDSNFQPKRENHLNGSFTIGYRYQKNTGGFLFRLSYSPIIEENKSFRHWGGVSVGYVF